MRAARILSVMRAALVLLGGVAASSLLSVSPLAHDPEPPSPSQRLSTKKDTATAGDDEGARPPLATLVNLHTDEVQILDDESPSIEDWSWLLRDRVTASVMAMAPQPLAMVRRLASLHRGARIELVSGFRSPKLNEVLRKKGHRVASHSQHSLGHAVDFRLVGMSPKQMRDEVRALGWHGGVGQYDKPSDWFIHIDVGRERSWHER